jgi:phage N-6-adenine-methyltransferase
VTIAGFRAQNHPQQISTRGARPHVDDRATDPELFARLHKRFNFSIDVAALPHNTKCARYFTLAEDGLEQSWSGERVWCNPPYSDIQPWLEKAWLECNAADLIVLLLPANRTEQGWWQKWIEPYRDKSDTPLRVEFLSGRQRFIAHNATAIGPNERPPFGVCLCIWSKA